MAERQQPRRTINPLPLICPRCGEKLTYVREDGDVRVYYCPNDGLVLHPPNGGIHVVIH